jgi:hypothetical protein
MNGRRLRLRANMNTRQLAEQEENAPVGIGVLLSLAAVLALAGAVTIAWDAVVQWPQIRSLFWIADSPLFVLVIIELLHTVRSSIRSHQLSCEPFLIVGMTATIRRILIVTLETSNRGEGHILRDEQPELRARASGVTGRRSAPSDPRFGHRSLLIGP